MAIDVIRSIYRMNVQNMKLDFYQKLHTASKDIAIVLSILN